MRNILLIIYLSLTPIFVATAATDIDSMECVLAKMPSGDRLVKLEELASDKGQGLDYKYYADRLLKEAELSKDDTYKGNALFQIIRYYYSRNIDSMYFFIKKAEPIYLAQKRYEDLCRIKGWYIYALSSNGEKERVLDLMRRESPCMRRFSWIWRKGIPHWPKGLPLSGIYKMKISKHRRDCFI